MANEITTTNQNSKLALAKAKKLRLRVTGSLMCFHRIYVVLRCHFVNNINTQSSILIQYIYNNLINKDKKYEIN